ncbi:MAG: MarR family transcriptional regulator [Oscillospiraceae bacterium]|nr:MarR family transcriptional regulator [Oscillospiraceae bacterium]
MTIKNRILVTLCHEGPASRAELAKRLDLSASHISEAVNELLEKEILVESGYRQDNSRGRKSTLLNFNVSYRFALGLGFADNIMSIGLTTVTGEVLGKEVTTIDPHLTKDELFDIAMKMVMGILRNCCLTMSSLLGIGLCVKQTAARRYYVDASLEEIIADVHQYTKQKIVFEPAEEYLQADPKIASISREELYLFGAAKVVRDLFLYADI